MNKFLISLFLFLSACISIEKIPSAKKDDGYSSLSLEDKRRIKDFSSDNVGEIQWINAKQLVELVKKNEQPTWVIIWASWCPHSINLLETTLSLYHSFHPILIAQNINLDYQTKLLSKINYQNSLNILNTLQYGSDEEIKSVKFLNELNVDYKKISKSIPINLLISNSGKILNIKYGGAIDDSFFLMAR